MPASAEMADEEDEERRQRKERRRREREKEKLKENINGLDDDGNREEERKRRRERRKEREKSGFQTDNDEAGDEGRRRKDREDGEERRRSDREGTGKTERGDDDDAEEDRRRRRRERRRQMEEENAKDQTSESNREEGKLGESNGEANEERRRRREERRRRKEREEMEKSDKTKEEGEEEDDAEEEEEEEERRRRRKEERRLRRKREEMNENENNQNSASPRTRNKVGSESASKLTREERKEEESRKRKEEESRKKKEEESRKKKEEKRREKKKDERPLTRAATSSRNTNDALSTTKSEVRPSSPLVDVLKTNRPPIQQQPSKSIPEDIVVERDSKENNFKALNVAAEADYASDFEKSEEEASHKEPVVPKIIASPAVAPTRSDYDMADIFRAMNEENQQLVGVGPEVTYDTSFAALPVEAAPVDAVASEASAAPAEWDFGGGGVNFGDALASMAMGRASQRSKDLRNLITLEAISFDLFDLPPAEEHQMYIRNISTHVAQKFVQTGEDNLDEEVQTEDVDVDDRWTQHPPEGLVVCGSGHQDADAELTANVFARQMTRANMSDDKNDGASAASAGAGAIFGASYDVLTLGKFLDAASSVLSQLIEEETQIREAGVVSGSLVTQGVFDVQTTPLMAGGRSGVTMAFPTIRPTVVALSFGAPLKSKTSPVRHCGSVCIWNLASHDKPLHILTTAPSLSTQNDTVVTSLCWSPTSCNVIVGGTKDGVVVLWDLREPTNLHNQLEYKHESFLVRIPTYSSAATSGDNNNHKTAIVSLETISHRFVSSDDSDSSFQMVSMETTGKIFLWTVLEVSPDPSGSEELLGLRPHGRLKLTKSSEFDPNSLTLEFPIANVEFFLSSASTKKFPGTPGWSIGEPFAHARGPTATNLSIDLVDNTKFMIATDAGVILHGHRQGAAVPHPTAYTVSSPEISHSPSVITSLSQHPFALNYLLVGTQDSTVFLFHREFQHPLMSWNPPQPHAKKGMSGPIIDVHWSPAKPSQFYVFQSPSTILTWDLMTDIAKPSLVNTLGSSAPEAEFVEEYRIVSAAVSQPFLNMDEKYSAFMGVSLKMGIMRIFKLTTMERKKREEETEKTKCLLEKIM